MSENALLIHNYDDDDDDDDNNDKPKHEVVEGRENALLEWCSNIRGSSSSSSSSNRARHLSNQEAAVLSVLYIQSTACCKCVKYSSTDRPLGGTFMTPYFPRRYPPSIDCLLYTFTGHPDEIVELTFHQFNIHRVRSEVKGQWGVLGDFICASSGFSGCYIKELVVGSPVLGYQRERHGRQTLGTLTPDSLAS
ncbi:hypothetical protein M0804_007664 [Polistes exclamans]|nr:hypothetical protein M0804_007664 [Polistes exclamans]